MFIIACEFIICRIGQIIFIVDELLVNGSKLMLSKCEERSSACWLVSEYREIWTETERREKSNAEINTSAGLDQE